MMELKSVGMMKFPTEWKVFLSSHVPVTTNQLYNIFPYFTPIHITLPENLDIKIGFQKVSKPPRPASQSGPSLPPSVPSFPGEIGDFFKRCSQIQKEIADGKLEFNGTSLIFFMNHGSSVKISPQTNPMNYRCNEETCNRGTSFQPPFWAPVHAKCTHGPFFGGPGQKCGLPAIRLESVGHSGTCYAFGL